jgi:hypothetical protein
MAGGRRSGLGRQAAHALAPLMVLRRVLAPTTVGLGALNQRLMRRKTLIGSPAEAGLV